MLKRLFPTRFEKAYIRLYNDRIDAKDFGKAAGIADQREAWQQLTAYRQKVINGQIEDPRTTYHRWR